MEARKLSEMSLEELWKLFPIFLTEHQSCWKEWYYEEEVFFEKSNPTSRKNQSYRKYSN